MNDEWHSDDHLFAELKDALGTPESAKSEWRPQTLPPIANFRIVRELHRGGQGIVYEAMQQNPSRRVALKVLLHGNFSSDRQRYRFDREIKLIARLSHPNIVTIFESGLVDGQPYYAMELIDGIPLTQDDRFRQADDASASEAREHLQRSLSLMESVCDAVACFQHQGLIHRDLKPDNILVDSEGAPNVVDFGLARQQASDEFDGVNPKTRTGEFLGTPAYAAPEQFSGEPDAIDTRSDIYSLGVILHELLFGVTPHSAVGSLATVVHRIQNETPILPIARNRAVDRDVETIVRKALAREPERRYQSAEQLAADLHNYRIGRPIEARRDSSYYVIQKTVRRHWPAFTAAAAFFVFLVLSSLISFRLWQKAETRLSRAIKAESSATAARRQESRQRKQAEFQGYIASLAAASGALRDYQVQEAYDHLHRVPSRLRDFEWWYLLGQIDNSILTWDSSETFEILAASPDKSLIVTAGREGSLRIRSVRSGQVLLSRDGVGRVTAVALHPSNDTLVVGFADGRLKRLNIDDREWGDDFRSLPHQINAIAVTPDGDRMIVISSRDPDEPGICEVRDFATDEQLARHTTQGHTLALSANGRRFVVAGTTMTLHNSIDGEVIATTSFHRERCDVAVFSEDNSRIHCGLTDQSIRSFDAESLVESSRFTCQSAETRSIAVHGPHLATAATDGTVRLWHTNSGLQKQVFWGHLSWVNGVLFDESGRRLISLEQKGAVKFWNPAIDVGDLTKVAHSSSISDLCYDSNGETVLTCSFSGSIKVWDVATGKRLSTLRGHTASVNSIDVSPDDTLVASGSADATVRIWNLASRKSRTLKGHTGEVLCVAFSPDGKVLASSGHEASIRLWDVESGKPIGVLRSGGDDAIRWLRFLPDGRRLLVEKRGLFELWDLIENERKRTWTPLRNTWFATAVVHPNGRSVALGDDAGRIRIWDIETGKSLASYEWHSMSVSALAFNPAGTRLVAASVDGAVKVWHVDKCVEVMSLKPSEKNVNCLQFSPDGYRLASGLHNGKMVWREAIPPSERLGDRF